MGLFQFGLSQGGPGLPPLQDVVVKVLGFIPPVEDGVADEFGDGVIGGVAGYFGGADAGAGAEDLAGVFVDEIGQGVLGLVKGQFGGCDPVLGADGVIGKVFPVVLQRLLGQV